MTKRLYMYDVRGIQDYIFRTNKLKEIIGASIIVEKVIIDLFKDAVRYFNYNYNMKYNSKDELQFSFDDNNTLDAEVLYYGGGNLYVLYENDEIAKNVSRKMYIGLVKKTYSLQLAVAGVDVTGENNYYEDYMKLREEMDNVKLKMPVSSPISSFPITLNEPQTGMAFSKKDENNLKCTYEQYLKKEAYRKMVNKDKIQRTREFGSKEGERLIAIVHIDGNNMGKRIQTLMKDVKTYKEAAKVTRHISNHIQHVFSDIALKAVEDKIMDFLKIAGINKENKEQAFRKIINAGDDITFICNASIALNCVKTFLDALEKEGTYQACAGIYITHFNFPFSRAYDCCEQLCANAKKLSRNSDGNYFDFHMNFSGVVNDIEIIREKQYTNIQGQPLIARPYCLGENKGVHLNELITTLNQLYNSNVSRSKLKNLREAFYDGEVVLEKEIARINSRLTNKIEVKNYRILFDAIDIMDLKWGDLCE